tara:strand:- start:22 stop:732 length:711 start_codon:yes stop_codon:yes gene_type:complete
MNLLSVNNDAKTIKGVKRGVMTGILYLAPHKISGYNMCAKASNGCAESCLYTAGRGKMSNVQHARIRKTKYFMEHRKLFMHELRLDIKKLIAKASRKDMLVAIRLNGTSDFPWETTGIMDEFPDVNFYDYTKIPKRAYLYGKNQLPKNYHLTFSRSENNMKDCWMALSNGCNVSFVFKNVPKHYIWGPRTAWDHVPIKYEVIDGDQDDLRFLDKKYVIVGLKAKGEARNDTSGFVI